MPDLEASHSTPSANTPGSTPPPCTTGGNWRWEPPSAEELQKLMPGYTIEKILGRGGMGAVYRGVQTNLDRPVAIKILPPGVEEEDPSFAERFKSEAKLMAKLNHPAVVAVYDFGTTAGGQLYFAMEYVDGSDVSQMIAAQGKLSPEHALAITAHVCDALQAAHELGIVHRDIKPANVLLNMKGQVKVADFGLAKVEEHGNHGLTKAGYAMGTPDFVAPEALMLGIAIDGRADLYAVGVMLYQMLTGIIPRGAFKPASALVQGLDPRFDPIIMKAMQHDRAERHQSAAELRRELDLILTVPFVRIDAPVSAAIPISHVAQAPGHRSVMQKPVGKPPQPRSAQIPERQPASAKVGQASRAPMPAAKSKSSLFIGLASAAAIGIIAFIMLSGGEKTKPKDLPASSSAANVAQPSELAETTARMDVPQSKPTSEVPERRMSSASPAANKPTVTSINKSGTASNAPPQWKKTEFANLGSGEKRLENGLLHLTRTGWSPDGPDAQWYNGAIRGTLLWEGQNKTVGTQLNIRGGNAKGHYSARPSNRELEVVFRKLGQPDRVLTKFPIEPPLKAKQEVSITIAAVGKKLIFWANGRHLGSLDHESQSQAGLPNITGADTRFKSCEVINLDGQLEAVALKILGVDEQGRDLRQPAVGLSNASDSSSKTAATMAAQPSSAKTPDSNGTLFPAGQWVQLLTPGSALPDGAQWDSKWLVTNGAILPVVLHHSKTSFTNTAFRATIKKDPTGARGILALRQRGNGGKEGFRAVQVPNVLGNPVEMAIQTSVNGTQSLQALSKGTVEVGDGQARTLEFCAVGSHLFLRINGKTVARANDEKPQAGEIILSQFKGRIRDIEIINLDGLSEVEAFKLLGMDEKGNDLPVLAAKQEEMPKAQAVPAAVLAKNDAMAAIPELQKLHEQFVKLQAERATAPFEAKVAKLNTSYLSGIDRKIAEMKQQGDLDSVLALEAEKNHVVSKQCLPANDEKTLPVVKDLRQIYWGAHAEIVAMRDAELKLLTDPLDTHLKQIESALTQQNRIEHAKTVREYREGLGKEKSIEVASASTRNDSTAGAASTMPEAAKTGAAFLKNLPPGDDRKAAEWVLDMGGIVDIHEVREGQRIYGKAELPKRSFDLVSIYLHKGDKTRPPNEYTNLSALVGLRKLSRVQIGGYPVKDDDIDYLATLPDLQELNIMDSWAFGGKKLSLLKPLEKLEKINLRNAGKLSAEGVAQVAQLTHLTSLNLSNCKLKDSDLPPLRQLKKLDGLNLSETGVTLAGWRELKELPLKSCGFSNPPGQFAEWCREIASLFPTIKNHYAWHGQGFPAGEIAALKAFGGLEELIISCINLDNATLAELLDFPKLNKLVLNNGGAAEMGRKVTDEGIAKLAKLRSLKTLRLEKMGEVTGEGVIALKQIDNLELPRDTCPKFDEAAFKKARPDVKISR